VLVDRLILVEKRLLLELNLDKAVRSQMRF